MQRLSSVRSVSPDLPYTLPKAKRISAARQLFYAFNSEVSLSVCFHSSEIPFVRWSWFRKNKRSDICIRIKAIRILMVGCVRICISHKRLMLLRYPSYELFIKLYSFLIKTEISYGFKSVSPNRLLKKPAYMVSEEKPYRSQKLILSVFQLKYNESVETSAGIDSLYLIASVL